MQGAPTRSDLASKIHRAGPLGPVAIIVLGLLFAVGTMYVGWRAEQGRADVETRVLWLITIGETGSWASVRDDILADPSTGAELRQLLTVPHDDDAFAGDVVAAIRAEHRTLSQALANLWDVTVWSLFVLALVVCGIGIFMIAEHATLRGMLTAARRSQLEAENRDAESVRLISQAFQAGPFGLHLFATDGRPLRSIPNITRRRGLVSFDFVAAGIDDIRTHPVLSAIGGVGAFQRAADGEKVQLDRCRLSLPTLDTADDREETIWFATTFCPIQDASGKVVQVLVVTRDETDHQALRDQLMRAERLAEVGTLAAGVAHEVNNPLTFLAMNASILRELLHEAPLDQQAVEALLNDFDHGVKRIQGVTSELSDLAHTASDPMQAVDLQQLVERTVHMCMMEVPEHIRLDVELPPLPTVRLSPRRMEQIVTNLVQNAVRACTSEPASITVRGGTEGTQCWIEVVDTGVGMPPEVQERIFEPFYTTRRGGQGTGLGLYLVRCYIEELGGSITVDSTLGAGTTMRVFIPADSDLWFSSVRVDADLRLLVVARQRSDFDHIRSLLPEVQQMTHAHSIDLAMLRIREQPQWDRILVVDPQDTGRLRAQIVDPKLRQRTRPLPHEVAILDRPLLEEALELHGAPARV